MNKESVRRDSAGKRHRRVEAIQKRREKTHRRATGSEKHWQKGRENYQRKTNSEMDPLPIRIQIENVHGRARTVSEHPRKASSGRSEALQGARWARGSSKGSCEAQSTSLSRSLASRKAISSDCRGLCLFHYILACEALFSATDGAMRACLWPLRPWFRARVRYSRSPLTCMTCLWIEKPVRNATKLPAQDQLRKHSAGVQHHQKSTKRTQTTDKVAENSQ